MSEKSTATPDILVVGAGALGCYFTAVLSRSGTSVGLLARGEAARVIRRHGISLTGASGEALVRPAIVLEKVPADLPRLIILATKAWQAREAVRALLPHLAQDAEVLTVQNGIETPLTVAELVGDARTLAGICRISCAKLGPATVQHINIAPSIRFASLNAGPHTSGLAKELFERLSAAGFGVEAIDDPIEELWRKLIFMVAFAGAGSYLNASLGEVRSKPHSRRVLEKLVIETAKVGIATGAQIRPKDVAAIRAFLKGMPGETKPSMQRDIERGLPSELNDIIGVVIRRARSAKVRTPVLDQVYGDLRTREGLTGRRRPAPELH